MPILPPSESRIEIYNYLLQKSMDKKLLKLIAHYSTSVIPHQLHLLELEKIIDMYFEDLEAELKKIIPEKKTVKK